MIKSKITKKLLAAMLTTTLATTSIVSMSLISPASASFKTFSNLELSSQERNYLQNLDSKTYNKILNKLDLLISIDLDSNKNDSKKLDELIKDRDRILDSIRDMDEMVSDIVNKITSAVDKSFTYTKQINDKNSKPKQNSSNQLAIGSSIEAALNDPQIQQVYNQALEAAKLKGKNQEEAKKEAQQEAKKAARELPHIKALIDKSRESKQQSKNSKQNNLNNNKPLLGNKTKRVIDKDVTVFDFKKAYEFTKDLIIDIHDNNSKNYNNLDDWSKKWLFPKDNYNKIADNHLKSFITDETIRNNGDSIDINMTLSALDKDCENVIENSVNKLLIPAYQIRHIVVGDELILGRMSPGHTKTSVDAVKESVTEYSNQLQNSMLTANTTVRNYLKTCVSSLVDVNNKLITKEEAIANNAYSFFFPDICNDLNSNHKGIFPDTWTWDNIKEAIFNIISNPDNLIYKFDRKKYDANGKLLFIHRYTCFFDKYKDIPIEVIVDGNNGHVVTTYPIKKDDFKRQIDKASRDELKYEACNIDKFK